jgi:nitroreductase
MPRPTGIGVGKVGRIHWFIKADSWPVAGDIVEECNRAACTAPSRANQQHWRFVAV